MNIPSQQQPAPPVAAAAAAPQPIKQLVLWEIEANALKLQGEHRLLQQLLCDFHNLNREQCAKLRAEGHSSLSDLINWKCKDICSLLENLSNRPTTRGGQQFGDRKINELQALSWFVTDRSRRELTFDLNLHRQETDQYIQLPRSIRKLVKTKQLTSLRSLSTPTGTSGRNQYIFI